MKSRSLKIKLAYAGGLTDRSIVIMDEKLIHSYMNNYNTNKRKEVEMPIEEIRIYIESNIKNTSDITASRIYELMTGRLSINKTEHNKIRVIT